MRLINILNFAAGSSFITAVDCATKKDWHGVIFWLASMGLDLTLAAYWEARSKHELQD
jgi:hypothetical protein